MKKNRTKIHRGYREVTSILFKALFFGSVISNILLVRECRDRQIEAELKATAELTVDFFKGGLEPSYGLRVSNAGDRVADSVWIYQSMYLVSGDTVYYCRDIPHFHYRSFRSSTRTMFGLAQRRDTVIRIDFDCFQKAALMVRSVFEGTLVTCWNVEYESRPQKREFNKFYYIYDEHLRPQAPERITGGFGAVEKVEAFERYGPRNVIEYVKETNQFMANPPRMFLLTNSGDRIPIDRLAQVPVGGVYEVRFRPDELAVATSGEAFVALIWECEGDTISVVLRNSHEPIY